MAKQNVVTIEQITDVLWRNCEVKTNEARMWLMAIVRAILDMELEDSPATLDQVNEQSARLFFYGDTGLCVMKAIGLEQSVVFEVASMLGKPCQSVNDFKPKKKAKIEEEEF